jgi:hypothetical protein
LSVVWPRSGKENGKALEQQSALAVSAWPVLRVCPISRRYEKAQDILLFFYTYFYTTLFWLVTKLLSYFHKKMKKVLVTFRGS